MKLEFWKNITAQKSGAVDSVAALLAGRELGPPISAGALSMLPLFGSAVAPGLFASPERSLVLKKVAGYGTMVFENRDERPAIVPLQLGYLQHAAQNHAMCGAALIAPKSESTFIDACCVQQGQGGLMTEHDARFIVLPHPLRALAFSLRAQVGYSKLWKAIAQLNAALGLKVRGHLDDLKHAHQPNLVRTLHTFEALEGQTGAVFFLNGRFLGLELAPDAEFWSELHTPLIMFCYAPLLLISAYIESNPAKKEKLDKTGITSVRELYRRLADLRERRGRRAFEQLSELAKERLEARADAKKKEVVLSTAKNEHLAGQLVTHEGAPAYASIFSTTNYRVSA